MQVGRTESHGNLAVLSAEWLGQILRSTYWMLDNRKLDFMKHFIGIDKTN